MGLGGASPSGPLSIVEWRGGDRRSGVRQICVAMTFAATLTLALSGGVGVYGHTPLRVEPRGLREKLVTLAQDTRPAGERRWSHRGGDLPR